MNEIPIAPLQAAALDEVVDFERARSFAQQLATSRDVLDRRTIWHVNSTARGGGVAEMLQSILGYLAGADIRCRWLVIDGDEPFFAVTKQLHHLLHGKSSDGGELPSHAREIYERVLNDEAGRIVEVIAPGDVVILNDPQTLGLAPALDEAGASVVFTSHIGADEENTYTRAAWQFLSPYVQRTAWQVFSRSQYAWPGLDPKRVAVIPPCLDPFSPKNQELDDDAVRSILAVTDVIPEDVEVEPTFRRQDGSTAAVDLSVEMIQETPLDTDATLVTQVSRWDPLKDHAGVLQGFLDAAPADRDVRLVLAGPSPESVADDPEGMRVFDELNDQWQALPDRDRARVHIACLPMDDAEQNAAIVNALQRRSDVIVQKSLAEGFGLTVAEAMWKGRATLATRVGGIQDQIQDGKNGVLLDDARDLSGMGRALAALSSDPDRRSRLGAAARRTVMDRYLPPEHLTRYLELATG